jgi:hypothetical protein
LGAAIQAFLPQAQVKSWHLVNPSSFEEIKNEIIGSDLILTQIIDNSEFGPIFGPAVLKDKAASVVCVPSIAFNGFHPDWQYIRGQNGILKGLFFDYHSVVVAASFLNGYSEARTERLFNKFTFSTLGYLSAFNRAKASMLQIYKSHGIDIGGAFDRWVAEIGQFMYSINHPSIGVLSDFAKLALDQSGILKQADARMEKLPSDDLANHAVLPVHSFMAKGLGVPGRDTIQINELIDGSVKRRNISIQEYITRVFAYYRTRAPEQINQPSITNTRNVLSGVVIA